MIHSSCLGRRYKVQLVLISLLLIETKLKQVVDKGTRIYLNILNIFIYAHVCLHVLCCLKTVFLVNVMDTEAFAR